MSQSISLRDAERKVFHTAVNDGLWDIFLGCFFLMFAIAPFLSERLGDFWSSVIFLPFWGLVYLAIRFVRKHVITPRLGSVKFGASRNAILMRFNLVMLVVNLLALVLGLIAASLTSRIPGQATSIALGLVLLAAFSFAAYFLGIGRLYIYALLLGLAPPIGEWLWVNHLTSHHGYPVTFGVISGIMILTGIMLLLRLLRSYQAARDDFQADGG
jgi:hypothetical protein